MALVLFMAWNKQIVAFVSMHFFLLVTGIMNRIRCAGVRHPLINFKKALEMLHKHSNKEHHKVAIVHAEEFERSMSGQKPEIQMQQISDS